MLRSRKLSSSTMSVKAQSSGPCASFSKQNSARYEFQESPGMPVVFRSKKYSSASDALSAYISEFEGREKRSNGTKYDQELMNLFCPQYQPTSRAGKPSQGLVRHGKSRREEELEKLVQQAYDQLRRLKESKKVQESLNASTRLLERIERDRLPSPTRSAILATNGRPSTESVATDVLLEAKPLDFTAPYSQPKQCHANNSLLESLDLKCGTANESFSTLKGPYHLRGMNELMDTMQQRESYGLSTGKSYSTDSLTVNDLLTSQKYNASSADTSRRSFTADSFSHKGDLLTTSQLDGISKRLRADYPHTDAAGYSLHTSWNGALGDNTSSGFPVSGNRAFNASQKVQSKSSTTNGLPTTDMRELDILLDNSWNKSPLSKKTTDTDLKQRQNSPSTKPQNKSQNRKSTKSQPKFNGFSSLPAYLTTGYGKSGYLNGSYTDKSMVSGGTDQGSSIISGHLLKGKQQRGSSKVVSTPKRGDPVINRAANSKQLRFDIDRSKSGHSLDSKDLSAHSKSLDLSNIEKVSVDKPDFTYGRREIVSILKPPSPGKAKKAGSRVSFTTDDLINADASGLMGIERRPRSKSLPRPQIASQNPENSHNSPLRTSEFGDRRSGQHSSKALKSTSRARMQDSGMAPEDVKQAKYKQFLEGLMREIEDSSSSIATNGLSQAKADISHHSLEGVPLTAAEGGPGFLARVKELLTSPPSVSQYMVNTTQDESLSTDAVLDGDRSWEQIVPFKAPKEIQGDEKKERTRFEKFMDDCMAEAGQHNKTLTGNAQPGALETLKNMMFKMQSFSSDPQTQEADDTVEGDLNLPLDDSVDKLLSPETKKLLSKSYSQQPGGPCLAKAMEHLNKLKDLVDNKEES